MQCVAVDKINIDILVSINDIYVDCVHISLSVGIDIDDIGRGVDEVLVGNIDVGVDVQIHVDGVDTDVNVDVGISVGIDDVEQKMQIQLQVKVQMQMIQRETETEIYFPA